MENGEIQSVLEEVAAIRTEMVTDSAASKKLLDGIHPNYRQSAQNLLHYLTLRRHDLRPLQLRLAALGLSSLGRAEPHVLATVDAVLKALHELSHKSWQPLAPDAEVLDFLHGRQLLTDHTTALLGPAAPGRGVRIMVTMPSEAAQDQDLVHRLVEQGMDCMRINCAYDHPIAWTGMINNLRLAERALGRSCRVVMDLAGPKLRTGPIQPGPAVVRIRPRRDVFGRVTKPARVWLGPEGGAAPPIGADACLRFPLKWLGRLRVGERVKFVDARGARRKLHVTEVTIDGCWAELTQTAYIVPGTEMRQQRRSAKRGNRTARVCDLRALENFLPLNAGELLILTRDLAPGRPAIRDVAGRPTRPATIGCTIPDALNDVRPGEPIWFDDGKIGGVIENVENDRVLVRITHSRIGGGRLRANKGINLPESHIRIAALTPKDVENLSFVARHADVVELSFANSARDVELLQEHLERDDLRPPAIVLKIETRRGFENLPDMLLTAMRWPCCGVMIARGDLAVECGFERLAEVQEEILWICEAAHIPVIWATQVLETLAQRGMASRAEITDAAMAHRAECVMLNKGPHIVSAVRALDDILRRMQSHQAKKRAMLRELRLAHALVTVADSDPTIGLNAPENRSH